MATAPGSWYVGEDEFWLEANQILGLLDIDQMIEARSDQVKPRNSPGIPQRV
jgi:hypothetical protein